MKKDMNIELKAIPTTGKSIARFELTAGPIGAATAGASAAAGTASSGAASTGASAGSASAGTATSPWSSWKASFKAHATQFKLWSATMSKALEPLSKALGKLFWAMIVAYVLGYFCPELREKIPYFYEFVDGGLDCFNQLWKWFMEVIKWYVHFITFGTINL